jgi:hypothetical protein
MRAAGERLHSVAAQDYGGQLTRLGKVEFKIECNAAAQQEFNRAMALYHSFAWQHATDAFAAVASADPSCGMAHWGRAMTMLDNPFDWPANLPSEKLSAWRGCYLMTQLPGRQARHHPNNC